MSLSDPQTITIGGVTTSLPRTSVGEGASAYTSADDRIILSVSHSKTKGDKRNRRMIRIDTSKISPDPFMPAENVEVNAAAYVVFDVPVDGFTDAEVLALWVGFKTQLSASSDAIITKLLGGES